MGRTGPEIPVSSNTAIGALVTTAYFLTVTLHVLATLVWLGGMLFFALIAPILRDIEDDALRASLFGSLGRRLRTVGWVCIAVLLATGVGQLHLRGWWGGAVWGTPGFWGSALGSALACKFGLVALVLTVPGGQAFGRVCSGMAAQACHLSEHFGFSVDNCCEIARQVLANK